MKKNNGFSLIEVMIVVIIIGILCAIAYPSYQQYIHKSHRAQARAALLTAASHLEKTAAATGVYATTLPESLKTVESKTYTIALASGASPTAYLLQALPTGAQQQDKCGALRLNSMGEKSRTGNAPLSECWP